MAIQNNVMVVRHRLLNRLIELWNSGQLVEQIDRLPLEFSPRKANVLGRCCVHKERAVWKYKSLPLLGFDMYDETDELTPLSEYAAQALARTTVKKNLMCVVDEACSSCVRINYDITNLCKGCVARSCAAACPKDAISFSKKTSQASINHDLCVSCGKCFESCPFHAIVYIPIPCEESCPVGAISKDEYGVEHIDESKCIYCGKCMNSCPFGAIFEISQIFDILESIRRGEKVVAMVAPAVLSQYDAPKEQVYGAIKAVGFSEIVEVAQGAMITTEKETEEFKERMESGEPFMTTSCCPAYVEMAEKHVPGLQKYISTTKSPMYYTAEIAKEKYPDAKLVFIGPCIAKRKEARKHGNIDYVMNFEELNAAFEGMGIKMSEDQVYNVEYIAVREAHGFAQTGGVTAAVAAMAGEGFDFTSLKMAPLNKKNIAMMKVYAKMPAQCPAQFIEVMACEGGCISGPSTHSSYDVGKRLFNKELLNH